jgi:hypothetical protein
MATKGKKKAARATSNVFAMFEQSQVQEFKEVNKKISGFGARAKLLGIIYSNFSSIKCLKFYF